MDDLISRQALLAEMKNMYRAAKKWKDEATTDDAWARAESCMATLIEMKLRAEKMPSAQPEIGYQECSDALLKMWMDNVLTDGEYGKIMDKLNEYWARRMNGE